MNKKVILILVTIGILALILSIISAARLPTVNGDSGTWGTVLNEFLNVSLNESGEIRAINLTLGQKITFAFGEVLDNIINNWIRITGNLNITENIQVGGNITASNFVGNLNGTLDGYDSSYFMPLNTSVSGDFDFNGGWQNGGVSISGGDIFVQTGYFYNITSLNVTRQNLTVIENLIAGGNVTADYFIGDGSQLTNILYNYNQTYTGITGKWNVSGSNLFPYDLSKNVGIGTSSPAADLQINTHTGTIPANTGIWITGPKTIRFGSLDNNAGYGAYIQPAFEGTGTERTTLKLGTRYGAVDKVIMTLKNSGNVGIGTESPSYPLEVRGSNATDQSISIWAENNISATGFITRTSIFDESKGSALSFIQDASYYLDEGEINHSKFYGYAGEFEVTDYSISEIETYDCSTLDEKTGEEVKNTCERIIYPYKKMEAGVLLDKEIDVLRQALVEIKSCTEVSYDWEAYKNCVNKV